MIGRRDSRINNDVQRQAERKRGIVKITNA
jgi:hypothetical protein